MPQYARLPPSGVKVIIVGAGFAGLAAAIECNRKGHDVVLLEKVTELKPLGDIISFASNAGYIFERWEGVVDTLDPISHHSDGINFYSWEGKFVTRQTWGQELKQYGRRINGHRAEIHRVVYEHALARGIEIRMGQNVTDYFETADGAGVVSNGEKVEGDCVFAAEGVKSRGRKIVLGFEDRPKASGYAVYRTWFASDELAKNERTKHLTVGDTHNGWIGEDKHFLAASIKSGREFSWVLTHKDSADIEESWQFPGNIPDVLANLSGWDPIVHDIVKATPPDRLTDYKLVFRDPLPRFISPEARIALIGDAAHPFLPTSIQGASQSMEDGVALAICLEKSPTDIPLALRAYQAIRYERVHRAQMTGVTTREQWHKADWDKIWRDPTSLHLKREAWLLDFDQEKYTYGVIEETLARLRAEKENRVDVEAAGKANGVVAEAVPKTVQMEVNVRS